MKMKGSTEAKNHNHILQFTSYLVFHKRLFSLSCLGIQVVLESIQPFIDN